jgi:hypothetical protein
MKIVLAVLGFCGLCLNLFAQRDLQTFTSPDGSFQFKYWHRLIRCTLNQENNGSPVDQLAIDACTSQAPMCNRDSSSSTFACFAFPKDKFKKKPTFMAATFFVSEIGGATTTESCLAGSKYWLNARTENTEINAATFRHFSISDAWLGGGQWGEIYRAFHNGKCYELGIQQAHTSSGGFDPGTIQTFTKQDQAEVDRRLRQVLHSFRFLK